MAGDWLKMRIDLQSHPKVVRILSALGTDKFRVVGGLHSVWSVFDTHSEDGVLRGYTPKALDHVIGWDGFSDAMVAVGWLEFDGAEMLSMPEFDAHNGQSAKRRAEDQKRKRNNRKMQENNGDEARTECGHIADQRREEKRRIKEPMSGDPVDAIEVLDYLNQVTGSKFKPVAANIGLISARLKEKTTVAEMKLVVDRQYREWSNDDKMRDYLRPATLFNATKFASYLGLVGNDKQTSAVATFDREAADAKRKAEAAAARERMRQEDAELFGRQA